MQNLIEVLLAIVLPVFGLVYVGYYFRKIKICTDEWVHALNQFVYYVSLPAVIGISFWKINLYDALLWSIIGVNALMVSVYALLLFWGLELFAWKKGNLKAAAFLVGMVGNTVYMGFPLLADAFGQAHLPYGIAAATTHLVLGLIFSLLAVQYWVLKSKRLEAYILEFIKNPFFAALSVGLILSWINFQGPVAEAIQKPVYMLGATASPLALFALGGFLHGRLLRHHTGRAAVFSAIKLLLFPVLVWLMAILANLPRDFAAMSVLVAGMPSAVTAFVIAEKYHLDDELVANAILLSTAVSVLTLAILLAQFV